MELFRDAEDGTTTVTVSGKATVEGAEEICAGILRALDQSDSVTVSCTRVDVCDLTFLQILRAAEACAAFTGKELRIDHGGNPAITQAARRCGMPGFP